MEDVENDLEPNLKESLKRKRKRKEAPTAESDNLLHCVKVKTPYNRIVYKLRRCTWPTFNMQESPKGGPKLGSLVCCMAQEYSEEKNGKKMEETQVMAKEELEEIDLGIDP